MSVSEGFTTIPVRRSTKKILETEKGSMSWDDFLLLLLKIKRLQEAKEALKRIKRRLEKSEKFVAESVSGLRGA